MAISYATSKNENIQIRVSNGYFSEEHKKIQSQSLRFAMKSSTDGSSNNSGKSSVLTR